MKAITICQPYAHLIVIGKKIVENRTWPTSYRGPLLIHAGKSRDWLELDIGGERDIYNIRLSDMAFGAIVGRASLTECLSIDQIKRLAEMRPFYQRLLEHEHTNGPFCFVLNDIVKFETPIPYRGAQGFFDVPAELVAQQRTAV